MPLISQNIKGLPVQYPLLACIIIPQDKLCASIIVRLSISNLFPLVILRFFMFNKMVLWGRIVVDDNLIPIFANNDETITVTFPPGSNCRYLHTHHRYYKRMVTYLVAAFALGLACAVFRYWLLKVSSVNYLPSQSYRTAIATTYRWAIASRLHV